MSTLISSWRFAAKVRFEVSHVVLSRTPLAKKTTVEKSANGTRWIAIDRMLHRTNTLEVAQPAPEIGALEDPTRTPGTSRFYKG